MKKTFTINICGIIFHIDDDAYDKLNYYLRSIKGHFTDAEGSDEIIADIEQRIAEMLQEKTSDNKQVITIDDINDVISVMGEPYEIGGEDDEPVDKGSSGFSYRPHKRLYRDPDNKLLGGVCSGIGSYFNSDPLWFRLAFIIAIFLGFSGVIVYLILWIVIPEARTTAEKLEMKGEHVNIYNIEKSIRDEIDHLKNKLHDLKDSAKDAFKKKRFDHQNRLDKIIDFFVVLVRYFVKAVIIIVGIFLILAVIFLMVGFFGYFFNSNDGTFINSMSISHFTIPDILGIFFTSPSQFTLGIIGLILLIGIPIIMLVYNGIKLLLGLKFKMRYIGISAFSLWLAGLIISGFIALQIAKEFSHKSVHKEYYSILPSSSNTLHIKMKANYSHDKYSDYDIEFFGNEWNIILTDQEDMFFGTPRLRITQSETDSFQIVTYSYARGYSGKGALLRAKKTLYNFKQSDDTIIFDRYFKLPENVKWRGQLMKIVIKVPRGKTINISKNMRIFFEVNEHVMHYYNDNFSGKHMEMTDDGLKEVKPEPPDIVSDTSLTKSKNTILNIIPCSFPIY